MPVAANSANADAKTPPNLKPRLLTVTAAAAELGLSRTTIYKLRAAGQITIGHVLGKAVITADELDRFVAVIDAQDRGAV